MEKQEEKINKIFEVKPNKYYKLALICMNCSHEFVSKIPREIDIQQDGGTGAIYYFKNLDAELDGVVSHIDCPKCGINTKVLKDLHRET